MRRSPWRVFNPSFVDQVLETGPDSDIVLPSAPTVPPDVDMWVGMASSVAIEGYRDLPPDAKTLRRAAAANNHCDARALRGLRDAWENLDSETSLEGDHLMAANRLILGGGDYLGEWRTVDVRVGNLLCCPPRLIPQLMERFAGRLEQWSDDPLSAWWAHLLLVAIHPWIDGNGRTARLVEAHLLRRNKEASPWASTRNNWINRPEYYRSIRRAETSPDPAVFYRHQMRMRQRAKAAEYDRFL